MSQEKPSREFGGAGGSGDGSVGGVPPAAVCAYAEEMPCKRERDFTVLN